MVAKALFILFFTSSTSLGRGSADTRPFPYPHRKKSHGGRSGDPGGHRRNTRSVCPESQTHFSGRVVFRYCLTFNTLVRWCPILLENEVWEESLTRARVTGGSSVPYMHVLCLLTLSLTWKVASVLKTSRSSNKSFSNLSGIFVQNLWRTFLAMPFNYRTNYSLQGVNCSHLLKASQTCGDGSWSSGLGGKGQANHS